MNPLLVRVITGEGPQYSLNDTTLGSKAKSSFRKSDPKVWSSMLIETGRDWMADNAMRLSAALALYSILSLAPLLVITVKIVSKVWNNQEGARQLFNRQISNLMGSEASEAIKPIVENSGRQGSGVLATVISTVVLIFSATSVFAELQDAMNTIWKVKPKPRQGIKGLIRNRLLSITMVFGIAFLLLTSMFISAVLTTLARYIGGDTKWLVFVVDIFVSYGVVSLLFAGIFKILPDVKIDWKDVWQGALLTSGFFIIGKYGLALYFKYATPTSAFGAAGSLAAVLLWIYYSAFILFFGAEFTKVWARNHGNAIQPDENAIKVTEEDRAITGIPSDERMKSALAEQTQIVNPIPRIDQNIANK